MDFSALSSLELIRPEALRVRRPDESLGDAIVVRDGKRQQRGDLSVFDIWANIQPMSGKQLQMLPEGDYITDALNVWQGTGHGPPLRPGDQFVRDGKTYEVRTANAWGPYVQAQATFISQGADR